MATRTVEEQEILDNIIACMTLRVPFGQSADVHQLEKRQQ